MTLAVDWAVKPQHNKPTNRHFKSRHFAPVCNALGRFSQWQAWHERFAPCGSHPWNLRNYIDISDEDSLRLEIPTRDVVTLIFRTRSCLYPCVSEAGRFGHGFDKHGHVTSGHYRTFAFRLDVSQLGVLQQETYRIEMSRCEVIGFVMSSCNIPGAKFPGPVCQVHFTL